MTVYSITLRSNHFGNEVVAKDVHLKSDTWHLNEEILLLKLTIASQLMASKRVTYKSDMRLPEKDLRATVKTATPKVVWTYRQIADNV